MGDRNRGNTICKIIIAKKLPSLMIESDNHIKDALSIANKIKLNKIPRHILSTATKTKIKTEFESRKIKEKLIYKWAPLRLTADLDINEPLKIHSIKWNLLARGQWLNVENKLDQITNSIARLLFNFEMLSQDFIDKQIAKMI